MWKKLYARVVLLLSCFCLCLNLQLNATTQWGDFCDQRTVETRLLVELPHAQWYKHSGK